MLKQLLFILFVVVQTFAATYYVESAPVAPFSCTQTQPCRLSDLPGAFTMADTIVFLPATTGVSSTYSFGSKTYTNPSFVLSAGTIYSASSLTSRSARSVNCTSASFVSNSLLSAVNTAVFGSVGCNYTASQFSSSGNGVIDFFNTFATGLSGSQRFLFVGAFVTVDGFSLKSSSSNQVPFDLRTGTTDEGVFIMRNIIFDTVTTLATASAIIVESFAGISFEITASNIAMNAVIADGALFEFRVHATSTTVPFYQEVDINIFTATGGSCKKGFMYANNGDDLAQMTANVASCIANGVNFKGNSVYLLNTGAGLVTLNANDMFNNNVCSPTNEPNLAECQGTTSNTAFLYSGEDEGSSTTKNCPTVYINAGSAC